MDHGCRERWPPRHLALLQKPSAPMTSGDKESTCARGLLGLAAPPASNPNQPARRHRSLSSPGQRDGTANKARRRGSRGDALLARGPTIDGTRRRRVQASALESPGRRSSILSCVRAGAFSCRATAIDSMCGARRRREARQSTRHGLNLTAIASLQKREIIVRHTVFLRSSCLDRLSRWIARSIAHIN